MGNEELKMKIRAQYDVACSFGTFAKLATIARELGESLSERYGPKYRFTEGELKIYVDDYGNYMTVHRGNEEIASTHTCDRFIKDGDWQNQLLKHFGEAQAKKMARESEASEKEKARLMAML